MKVIKNFKRTGKFIDEFPYIKIKEDEDVFADLPICLVEYNTEYQKPMIYIGPEAQIPVVMEEKELIKKIQGTKLFYLKVDEEKSIREVEKEEV